MIVLAMRYHRVSCWIQGQLVHVPSVRPGPGFYLPANVALAVLARAIGNEPDVGHWKSSHFRCSPAAAPDTTWERGASAASDATLPAFAPIRPKPQNISVTLLLASSISTILPGPTESLAAACSTRVCLQDCGPSCTRTWLEKDRNRTRSWGAFGVSNGAAQVAVKGPTTAQESPGVPFRRPFPNARTLRDRKSSANSAKTLRWYGSTAPGAGQSPR